MAAIVPTTPNSSWRGIICEVVVYPPVYTVRCSECARQSPGPLHDSKFTGHFTRRPGAEVVGFGFGRSTGPRVSIGDSCWSIVPRGSTAIATFNLVRWSFVSRHLLHVTGLHLASFRLSSSYSWDIQIHCFTAYLLPRYVINLGTCEPGNPIDSIRKQGYRSGVSVLSVGR